MDEQVAILRRVLTALEASGASSALVGGHAVSAHTRPRVTEDVDLIVDGRRRASITEALEREGFSVRAERDVLRVLLSADAAQPVADLHLSESGPVWGEALRTAVEQDYQGARLRVATLPALGALKFIAATNTTRPQEDRLVDVSDVSRLVKKRWSAEDAGEARRIAELAWKGAGEALQALVEDLLAGRPVTV